MSHHDLSHSACEGCVLVFISLDAHINLSKSTARMLQLPEPAHSDTKRTERPTI